MNIIWSYIVRLWKWLMDEELTIFKLLIFFFLLVALASGIAWLAIYTSLSIYARGE